MIAHLSARLLLPALIALVLPGNESALLRSGVSQKDLAKLTKDVGQYYVALEADERSDMLESLEKIEAGWAKSAKRAKVKGRVTTYLGDFEVLLQLAKPEDRHVKSKSGKGFFKHVFEEPSQGVHLGVMLSLPAGYGKGGDLLPVIVALKPRLEVSGSELESKVAKMAEAAYGDLLQTHIVLIPLGPDSGKGRSARSAEVGADWMSDEGQYAFYTAYRVLLEQIRFDRARVILDGWGDTGLDALRIITTSSYFAGLMLRSGEVAAPDLIGANLAGLPVLYIRGAGDGAPSDLSSLTGISRSDVEVVEEPGSALDPSDATRTRMAAWIDGTVMDLAPSEVEYRLGDIRFQARSWCKTTVINSRQDAKPDDPDFPRFKVRADKAHNRIEIDSVNVLEMDLSLSDALLDMGSPVTIVANGEVKRTYKPRPSLRYLLDNRFYQNSQDDGLYTDHVLIEDIDANTPTKH